LSKVLDLPVVEELINQVTAVRRDIEEIARLINNNAVVRKKVNSFYEI
jgi:PII-like signaling protein